MNIEKQEDMVALAHSLEHDEEVNLAIRLQNGNAKLKMLDWLHKELRAMNMDNTEKDVKVVKR